MILAGSLGGCADDNPPAPESREVSRAPGENVAWDRIDELRSKNRELQVVGARRFPGGELHHVRIRWPNEGALSSHLGVTLDGRVLELTVAEQEFTSEYKREWGAIALETAERILALPPESPHRFAVFVTADDSGLAAIAFAAGSGKEASLHETSPRFAEAYFTPAFVRESLAMLPGVLKIVSTDYPIDVHAVDDAAYPSSAMSSLSWDSYFQRGLHADGVRVGIFESPGDASTDAGCKIRDDHEAFTEASVTYQRANSFACTTDADCIGKCSITGEPGVCVNGSCYREHATMVASRVASYQSNQNCKFTGGCDTGPFHAGQAELYVAQTFTMTPVAGSWVLWASAANIADGYDWYVNNDVDIVNESWGILADTMTYRGVLADSYAREHGMLIVQSAGDHASPSDPNHTVACEGLNTLCVGAFTPGTNPAVYANGDFQWDLELDWVSRFLNKMGLEARLEIERPDVTAEGGGVAHVASVHDVSGWTHGQGTSFAAPVVTGLAALMTEDCDPASYSVDPLKTRAIFRTAGWEPHRLEHLNIGPTWPETCPPNRSPFMSYPTADARFGCDYKAGAGAIRAHTLRPHCGGEGGGEGGSGGGEPPGCGTPGVPCVAEGEGSADDPGWTSYPWLAEGPSPDDMYDDATKHQQPLRQQPASSLEAVELYNYKATGLSLEAGRRVRFTLAYNSCPFGASSSTLANAVNFDVVLRGVIAGQPDEYFITASESLDDTIEGFDVILKHDYSELRVYLVKPKKGTYQPCPISPGEPFKWAAALFAN